MKKPAQTAQTSKNRTQPITDEALRSVAGGGGEAYFVRCDRSTVTQ
jgi:hypothetical protein